MIETLIYKIQHNHYIPEETKRNMIEKVREISKDQTITEISYDERDNSFSFAFTEVKRLN
jgi:hypothetical protein